LTAKQLAKRVDRILGEMRPLGLGHWVITLSIVPEVDHETSKVFDANAACTCSTHYDRMWLEFNEDFLNNSDDEDIDRVIVHELLHAAMRDFDHAVHGVNEYLGEPHKSAWQDEVNHAREGLVERLAYTITLMLRSNVVQSTK
jgi:hypothetical protein